MCRFPYTAGYTRSAWTHFRLRGCARHVAGLPGTCPRVLLSCCCHVYSVTSCAKPRHSPGWYRRRCGIHRPCPSTQCGGPTPATQQGTKPFRSFCIDTINHIADQHDTDLHVTRVADTSYATAECSAVCTEGQGWGPEDAQGRRHVARRRELLTSARRFRSAASTPRPWASSISHPCAAEYQSSNFASLAIARLL